MTTKLVLSIPYIRVSRALLSAPLLGLHKLKHDLEIVVVSPFSDNDAFRSQHGCEDVSFVKYEAPTVVDRPYRYLYSLAEQLRMLGYYYELRNSGMKYYWQTLGIVYGPNGDDRKLTSIQLLAKRLIGFFGSSTGLWRSIDKLIGSRVYENDIIDELFDGDDEVILIQASSWGFQDKMLAWYSSQKKCKSALVPYTTDQLWVNGYLLNNYDLVCVQGPFEDLCARKYHQVPDKKILRLGSTWFRNVDEILDRIPQASDLLARRKVVYAGVAIDYFPRQSEFEAVDFIADCLLKQFNGDVDLIYRPFATSHEEQSEIVSHYEGHSGVILQWPEQACAGLEEYSGSSIEMELASYLTTLAQADVLIMSHTTSLGWDAAYLDCGVIANFFDGTGTLDQRMAELRFLADGKLDCAPGMEIARSLEELASQLTRMLVDDLYRSDSAANIVKDWDYSTSSDDMTKQIFEHLLC